MQRSYNIQVIDSILKPGPRTKGGTPQATYKKAAKGGRNLYLVHIYLEGPDLAFVKRATYTLHKTFRNPVQVIERSAKNQNCMLSLWTWGIFTVKVEIEDLKGNVIQLDHYLNYGAEIQNNKNISWIDKS